MTQPSAPSAREKEEMIHLALNMLATNYITPREMELKLARAYLGLEARCKRLEDALEDLYMNTSTYMPAAWNDELSWYRSQLHSVIGRAARAHKQLDSEQP